MHFAPVPRSQALGLGLIVICAALLAGCGGPPRGGPGGDRARLKPTPPLAGRETFFDGHLLVEINVSAFGFKGRDQPGEGGGGPGGPGGRRGGGGMALSGGIGPVQGGMGGGGGRRGGPPGGGPADERGTGAIDPEQYRVQNIQRAASRRPPVMIHVRVTNHGAEPATVRILDFLSPLGNFVVLPEKLEIPAGQSVETEPMASQLGGQFTEVGVTLVVHTAGRKEKKTVTLRADPAAPGLDGPPPADAPPEKN